MTSTFIVAMTGMVSAFIGIVIGLLIAQRLELRRKEAAEAEREVRERDEAARRKALQEQRKAMWAGSAQPQPGSAGFTIASALNGLGCLGRSAPDEPVFVLCARDKAASMVVRDWAALAEKMGAKANKTSEALELADRMEAWRERHGGGKIPD